MSMPSSRQRRRDDAAQAARLEVVLDLGALLLARPSRGGRGRAEARGILSDRRIAVSSALASRERDAFALSLQRAQSRLAVDLVQPRRQPLGQPARVGEHDRRAVPRARASTIASSTCGQIDGFGAPPAARALVVDGCRDGRRLRHVLDRHDDAQVEGLRRGRLHDRHGRLPAEEPRDLLDRAHRRREPDALRGLREQRVEPLERSPRGARRAWCRRPRASRRR